MEVARHKLGAVSLDFAEEVGHDVGMLCRHVVLFAGIVREMVQERWIARLEFAQSVARLRKGAFYFPDMDLKASLIRPCDARRRNAGGCVSGTG